MTYTPDELQRAVEPEAVEYLRLRLADESGYINTPDIEAIHEILSERAELLATVERMRDKVEGLDSDLRCAVQVAYLRGATEWAERNYPGMIEWLESCVTARAALTTGEATTPNAGEKG